MLQKIKDWYRTQIDKNKLLVVFLSNLFMWLFIQVTGDLLFPREHPLSIKLIILKALVTATIWTLLFNWKTVKGAFAKRNEAEL
ncbi:MAG: hypothetical protein ABIN57_00245 [Chitinophagaceae bacterium]